VPINPFPIKGALLRLVGIEVHTISLRERNVGQLTESLTSGTDWALRIPVKLKKNRLKIKPETILVEYILIVISIFY
jgi:hypothetical protein